MKGAVPDTPTTNTAAGQTPATLNSTVVCDMTQFVNNDIDGFTGRIKSRSAGCIRVTSESRTT